MSTLSFTQVKKLLTVVSQAVPDSLNCDDCFELLAEFADAEIRGDELSEALMAVKVHFSQCPCCAYEYSTLLEVLQEPEMILN